MSRGAVVSRAGFLVGLFHGLTIVFNMIAALFLDVRIYRGFGPTAKGGSNAKHEAEIVQAAGVRD